MNQKIIEFFEELPKLNAFEIKVLLLAMKMYDDERKKIHISRKMIKYLIGDNKNIYRDMSQMELGKINCERLHLIDECVYEGRNKTKDGEECSIGIVLSGKEENLINGICNIMDEADLGYIMELKKKYSIILYLIMTVMEYHGKALIIDYNWYKNIKEKERYNKSYDFYRYVFLQAEKELKSVAFDMNCEKIKKGRDIAFIKIEKNRKSNRDALFKSQIIKQILDDEFKQNTCFV